MADAERTCDRCGKTFKSDGAWYAKHALKCDGSGRADAGRAVTPSADRAPTARKPSKKRKPAVSRKTPSRRAPKRAHPAAAAVAGVTPAQMLAALRAERDKIDVAIASIEALA